MPDGPSPLRSTITVSALRALATILSLILGVLSAAYFGASREKDCLVVAEMIPRLLTTLIVGGLYSTLLVALSRIGGAEGGTAQLHHLRWTLRRISFMLAPVLLVAMLMPQPVIRLIAPGFRAGQVILAGRLLTITTLTMVGAVHFALMKSLFNSRGHFAVPGLTNLLIGLLSIGCLVAMVDQIGIFALAVGSLAGTLAAAIVITLLGVRMVRKAPPGQPGAGSRDRLPAQHGNFWRDFFLMSVSANFAQVNLLVDNAFASFLPTGSIALLGFAFVVVTNVQLLTTLSLAEVAFPRMAVADQQGGGALGETLRVNLRYMVLGAAPLVAGLMTFGGPMVRLLLERGRFGPGDTRAVAGLLICYGPGMLFAGYLSLFWRALVARRRFKQVAWCSAGAVVANLVLDSLLMRPFGIYGIAAATSVVQLLHLLILVPIVRREVGAFYPRAEWRYLFRVLAGAALMGGVVLGWAFAVSSWLSPTGEASRFVEFLSGTTLGALTYLVLLRAFRIGEAHRILARFLRSAGIWRSP
ncbi:MAG: murein biosynthesis integral membrane protein MurJ [Gemmatimonadota bacterium]